MTDAVLEYDGYRIPLALVDKTGGGADTWEPISRLHMDEYARYAPIQPGHAVLEVGCGVGRDAIQITRVLDSRGRYVGVDIIEPSIRWCQQNITPRHPNFAFVHFDVHSQIHNPQGTMRVEEVRMPAADRSVDRILLQSVFTHMFEPDIVHYLAEFRRVLAPEGTVFATFFLLDVASLAMAESTGQPLTFRHRLGDDVYVNDPDHPEGAVGYTEAAVQRMIDASGLRLLQPIHRGAWCGREGMHDSQDVCILGR